MMQPFRKQQRLQRRPMQTFCSKPKNCKPKRERERERDYPQTRITPLFINTLSQYIND